MSWAPRSWRPRLANHADWVQAEAQLAQRIEFVYALEDVAVALGFDVRDFADDRLEALVGVLAAFRQNGRRQYAGRLHVALVRLALQKPLLAAADLLGDVALLKPGYARYVRGEWAAGSGDDRVGKIERLLAAGSGATDGERAAARAALARIRGAA